jgi:hypothetical protein
VAGAEDGPAADAHVEGLKSAAEYPLLKAIFNRRSRRIMKGLTSVPAGSASYTSTQERHPLTALEEAVLIAVLGRSGLAMPDRPFQDTAGKPILGTPNVRMRGRTAGSADNAQNTHFFMMNDTGTFYLHHLPEPNEGEPDYAFTAENLLARAEKTKKQIRPTRLELPRQFPFYLDSNRFLSNLPGSTIFVPVIDMSVQYINGLMYILTQEPGRRPVLVDDRNGFKPAGNEKWIANGFLNKDITLPLGLVGTFRAQIEADLLMQNLMLTLTALGLGGWIHASYEAPFLLGHPKFANPQVPSLGFRYVVPDKSVLPVPDLKMVANPVGLDGVIEGFCPPYHKTMSDAVDALLFIKYGYRGTYNDPDLYKKIFKGDMGDKYLKEVPHYEPEVIACVKSICEYIYATHGRFPAHVDAIQVPGIWLQAHHLDLKYYDKLFVDGYTSMHRDHDRIWHAPTT